MAKRLNPADSQENMQLQLDYQHLLQEQKRELEGLIKNYDAFIQQSEAERKKEVPAFVDRFIYSVKEYYTAALNKREGSAKEMREILSMCKNNAFVYEMDAEISGAQLLVLNEFANRLKVDDDFRSAWNLVGKHMRRSGLGKAIDGLVAGESPEEILGRVAREERFR